jgi:hypothetical protein
MECQRVYEALMALRRKQNKSYQDRELLRALGREHHLCLLAAQGVGR